MTIKGYRERKKIRIIYAAILFFAVISTLEILGYIGMVVRSGGKDFLTNKNYFNIRAMLRGDHDPDLLPRYISLPYVGYIPYPNYSKFGFPQHNSDGYRGDKVPLIKTNKYRILCLGGSTTYGSGVMDPRETYPAKLEQLVTDYIALDSSLSLKYKGAEVINAGLEGGNSAEELQQYLAKYRYYEADVVVLHTGVNDALLLNIPLADFQLDYTHRRRLNFHLEPLPQPARSFMRSYFFSLLTIMLYYDDFSSQQDEFFRREKDSFIAWSHVDMDSVIQHRDSTHYPFYRNTSSLVREIKADGAIVLLLPNALNIHSDMVISAPKYQAASHYNDSLLQNIAIYNQAIYVPFTFDSIRNESWWLDDCHLNAAGEKNKAEIVFRFVKQTLDNNKQSH